MASPKNTVLIRTPRISRLKSVWNILRTIPQTSTSSFHHHHHHRYKNERHSTTTTTTDSIYPDYYSNDSPYQWKHITDSGGKSVSTAASTTPDIAFYKSQRSPKTLNKSRSLKLTNVQASQEHLHYLPSVPLSLDDVTSRRMIDSSSDLTDRYRSNHLSSSSGTFLSPESTEKTLIQSKIEDQQQYNSISILHNLIYVISKLWLSSSHKLWWFLVFVGITYGVLQLFLQLWKFLCAVCIVFLFIHVLFGGFKWSWLTTLNFSTKKLSSLPKQTGFLKRERLRENYNKLYDEHYHEDKGIPLSNSINEQQRECQFLKNALLRTSLLSIIPTGRFGDEKTTTLGFNSETSNNYIETNEALQHIGDLQQNMDVLKTKEKMIDCSATDYAYLTGQLQQLINEGVIQSNINSGSCDSNLLLLLARLGLFYSLEHPLEAANNLTSRKLPFGVIPSSSEADSLLFMLQQILNTVTYNNNNNTRASL